MNAENAEATATRLAGKLSQLTSAGKVKWLDAGQLGPWGEGPGQAFKTEVEDGSFAQIAEVPVPRSLITSYYFGVLEGSREVFEVFAEGLPAEPTAEQRELWRTLKNLYLAAKDSARGTWQIIERFEQGLERRLA
jgi:hypothetical protein